MSNVTRSLHRRFNRNHSPKCLSWDSSLGYRRTSFSLPIVDNPIQLDQDWTLAFFCKVGDQIASTTLYSDRTETGTFYGTRLFVNYSIPQLVIDLRSPSAVLGSVFFPIALDEFFVNEWATFVFSYNGTTKDLTVFYRNKTYVISLTSATQPTPTDRVAIYGVNRNLGDEKPKEFSSCCFLDKQATNEFVESFNKFGLPDSGSFTNVTFFTTLDKVNDQGTYVGLECSTKFFNPNSTTREIEFDNWTDEELGLTTETQGITTNCLVKDFYTGETEDLYGLDMGRLWETFRPSSSIISINLESGTTQHATDWTNGWTVSWRGNLAKTDVNVSNNVAIAWFTSDFISLRSNNLGQIYLSIVDSSVSNVFLVTDLGLSNLDKSNLYTVTADTNGDFKLFVNGIKVNEGNRTYIPLNDTQNSQFLFTIGVLSPQRYYKYYQSVRVYDGVLTETQCKSTLGSELDSYSPLCSYATTMNSSSQLIDNIGNLNPSSVFNADTNIDTVIETKSGFQPRRNGLKFEASKEQYLKISGLPQLDTTEGFTLLMSIKDFDFVASRTLTWFSDDNSSVDNVIRVVYRKNADPLLDNQIGFIAGLNTTGRESRFYGVDSSDVTNLQMRASDELQITPLNQNKRIDKVNNRTLVRDFDFFRSSQTTYDLYVGGIPLGVDFASEQYTDMTLEGLILVRGILQDSEIQEIMAVGKLNNVPLSLQEKYDFDLILDLNKDTYYDDNGTLKLKDLSGNNIQVETISDNGAGWQTLTDLVNSATQL